MKHTLTYGIWRVASSDKHYVINHALKKIHSVWDSSVEAHEVYKRLNKSVEVESKNKERMNKETAKVSRAKRALAKQGVSQ